MLSDLGDNRLQLRALPQEFVNPLSIAQEPTAPDGVLGQIALPAMADEQVPTRTCGGYQLRARSSEVAAAAHALKNTHRDDEIEFARHRVVAQVPDTVLHALAAELLCPL